ncbi:MAG: bacteriophage holin [Candidatus Margulisiibacteriota bacterium]|nr:bacteriophage holin [Candidatus Margulisiibacteriota bacterium]
MKLDSIKFGLAIGIVWAAAVFCLGLMATFFNWGTDMVRGLGSLYLGYSGGTVRADIVGMVWAFFDGFVGGTVVAMLYNWLLKKGNRI